MDKPKPKFLPPTEEYQKARQIPDKYKGYYGDNRRFNPSMKRRDRNYPQEHSGLQEAVDQAGPRQRVAQEYKSPDIGVRTHVSRFVFFYEYNDRKLAINVGERHFSVIDMYTKKQIAHFASDRPFPQNLVFEATIGSLSKKHKAEQDGGDVANDNVPCLFLCYCGLICVHFFDSFEVEIAWRACTMPRMIRQAGDLTCFVDGDVGFSIDGIATFVSNTIEIIQQDGAPAFQLRIQGRIGGLLVSIQDGMLKLFVIYQTPNAMVYSEQVLTLPESSVNAYVKAIPPSSGGYTYVVAPSPARAPMSKQLFGTRPMQIDIGAPTYILQDRQTTLNPLLAGNDIMFKMEDTILLAQRGSSYIYLVKPYLGEVISLSTFKITGICGSIIHSLVYLENSLFVMLAGDRICQFELKIYTDAAPDIKIRETLECARATDIAVLQNNREICCVSSAPRQRHETQKLVPERNSQRLRLLELGKPRSKNPDDRQREPRPRRALASQNEYEEDSRPQRRKYAPRPADGEADEIDDTGGYSGYNSYNNYNSYSSYKRQNGLNKEPNEGRQYAPRSGANRRPARAGNYATSGVDQSL